MERRFNLAELASFGYEVESDASEVFQVDHLGRDLESGVLVDHTFLHIHW